MSSPNINPDSHLDHLLEAEQKTSFFSSLVSNLRDVFQPTKYDPSEFTSQPADPGTMLLDNKRSERFFGAGFISLVVNCSILGLALWLGTLRSVQSGLKNAIADVTPIFAPPPPPALKAIGGGGGGGTKAKLPPTKGELPKPAPRQLIPPPVKRPDHQVELPVEPTIVAQVDAPLPKFNAPNFGDPLAKINSGSAGGGTGGGIGGGSGTGVGSGDGNGYGPGRGGNTGGGAYRVGQGASRPVPIFQPQPEYSEEARKAKFQGEVTLSVTVGEDGTPRDIKVVRPLGLGLDEKAIEAVSRWRFRPGMKDGRAVAVRANVVVTFRLL